MSDINKYAELSNWFQDYPAIGSWLYFNVTNIAQDNVSLNSVQTSRYIQEFTDGSRERELNFAIDMIKGYDEGTSNTNLEALQECESISLWVEEKMENDELPTFEKCMVHEVEILDSTPALSVDNEAHLAKYQIQGKVKFLESKGD